MREERQLAERHRQAGRVGAGYLQLFVCVAVWFTRMQVRVKAREQPRLSFSRCHIIFSDGKYSKLAGQYPRGSTCLRFHSAATAGTWQHVHH